jgi:hypothetical protein
VRLLGLQAVFNNRDFNALVFQHGCGGSISVLRSYSAVVGSITDRTCEIRLAGNPPCWACLRTASSLGAMYTQ